MGTKVAILFLTAKAFLIKKYLPYTLLHLNSIAGSGTYA